MGSCIRDLVPRDVSKGPIIKQKKLSLVFSINFFFFLPISMYVMWCLFSFLILKNFGFFFGFPYFKLSEMCWTYTAFGEMLQIHEFFFFKYVNLNARCLINTHDMAMQVFSLNLLCQKNYFKKKKKGISTNILLGHTLFLRAYIGVNKC